MRNMSLETIHKDITGLKREILEIKILLASEPELREDTILRISEARKRLKTRFVSHEQMKREFANQ